MHKAPHSVSVPANNMSPVSERPVPMHCRHQVLEDQQFPATARQQCRDSFGLSQSFKAPDFLLDSSPFLQDLVSMPKTWLWFFIVILQQHISNISETAFYHLRHTSKVKCFLSDSKKASCIYFQQTAGRLDSKKWVLTQLQLIHYSAAWVSHEVSTYKRLIVLTSMKLSFVCHWHTLTQYTPDGSSRSCSKGFLSIRRMNSKTHHDTFSQRSHFLLELSTIWSMTAVSSCTKQT